MVYLSCFRLLTPPAFVLRTLSAMLCSFIVTANRLPGLQSSKQNLEEENEVYDKMMLDLIRLAVLPPLLGCPPDPGLFEVSTPRRSHFIGSF